MIFTISLILIVAAGVLAVRADTGTSGKRLDVVAALILMIGLSLIGWGLNVRH